MKKIIPSLILVLALHFNTQAQQATPVLAGVRLNPDMENPEGCVLTGTGLHHTFDDQSLYIEFSLQQLKIEEDVKFYFGDVTNAQVNITFRRSELLNQVLNKEYSEQVLRIDAMMIMNGQNVPVMFEAVKKKDKQKQVYSELTFSVPNQSMGLTKQGEVKMALTLKSI